MKLWVFGDSYSKKFGDKYGWDKKYTNLKGYYPKCFGEILSEKMNLELMNFADYGYCNDDIFHTFVEEIDNIKDEDIIIFQLGSSRILRLVDKSGEFRTIDLTWYREYQHFNEEQVCIDSILANRNSEKYNEEINDWVKIIKIAKPNNNLIFWTPVEESSKNTNILPYRKFTSLSEETNNEIMDQHYGEVGHQELADYLFKVIKQEKNII